MKLRKLTLAGFKSFADRTEFVFEDGISCIVGPNGCGKSNVVDAVKWVLGEQSAKSLRGSEMMDVIFNGSSSRRPAGMAEVTLEFDNESGLLQSLGGVVDPKKPNVVSVARRLYRSGESEYLINGQAARLRDIREMFMDTGVGTEAYSLIEQGRVAEMLQASPRDRRAIFEEAAGISKYKARKKEAVRKLERVGQNLLRVNDILAEVQKRLRSIKYQAGKARNYQAYSERLKDLRGQFSLAQYHELRTGRLDLQGRLDQLSDELTGIVARIDQLEANRASAETESAELERQARQIDGETAGISAQITTCEDRIEMLTARAGELAEQIAAAQTRDKDFGGQIDAAGETIEETSGRLMTIELQLRQCDEQVEAMIEEQAKQQLDLTRDRAELEDDKAGTIDLLRRMSQLHNEITAAGVRRESLAGQKRRLADRAEQIAGQMTSLIADRTRESDRLEEIAQVVGEATGRLEQSKAESAVTAEDQAELDEKIDQARQEQSSLSSRHNTLAEMQKRNEGLGGGVKKVLAARKQGKLGFVRGIVADYIDVEFADAAVVEAALGGLDQALVVDTLASLSSGRGELQQVLESASAEIICIDHAARHVDDLDLSGLDVSSRRLMDILRVEDEFAPTAWAFLGRTVVVDDLEAARAAASRIGRCRWVTRDGAVLEPDGRVRIGRPVASGIISRRSELAKLVAELAELAETIGRLTSQRKVVSERKAHLEEVQQKLRTAIYEANTERVDHQSRLARVNEQLVQLEREQPLIANDIEAIATEIASAVQAERDAGEKVVQLESLSAERQTRIDELSKKIVAGQARLEHVSGQLTDSRVKQAQLHEQRSRMAEEVSRLNRSIEQMTAQRQDLASQVQTNRQRIADAQQAAAQARDDIERFLASKADLEQQAVEIDQSRIGLTGRVEQIRAEIAAQRKAQQETSERAGKLRVEAGEVDVRIENLITRASDELGTDLVAAYGQYAHDGQRDWDQVRQEIQDLRLKIERLGNVNLDAIVEQEELEQREQFLTTQISDVNDSRRQLDELIERINIQSKEMFETTFAAIRENFQAIFRKLFGGGKADVLLMDADDVLECGIEVIARPPGKELRSISLLSGGEKTMVTVALLFSIFKAKPSPFCILDEVDAALDEVNIDRFNVMVREFLDQSQFILVTHSKRTMVMADVLYGVTMQEPGVSRRISVRFEEAAAMADEDPAAVAT